MISYNNPNKILLEQNVQISNLEKKVLDLSNNQVHFKNMIENLNNLSNHILDEVKEIKNRKEKNNNNNKYNENKNNNLKNKEEFSNIKYQSPITKNRGIINFDINSNDLYFTNLNKKYTNIYIKRKENDNVSHLEKFRFDQEKNETKSLDRNYLIDKQKKNEFEINNTSNKIYNENIYNPMNFNNKKYENNFIQNKKIELLPILFYNEKLFSSFEIKDQSIKKINQKLELGYEYENRYFGIRCKNPLPTERGNNKFYFNLLIENSNKLNIFFGITSDLRIGIIGGFHNNQNTIGYNLNNYNGYIGNTIQKSEYSRLGRKGDIFTFYIDFDLGCMKLFLNGNEINNNLVNVKNENNFYPCLDVKDINDQVRFVDKIFINCKT
jgi:hypothetical protein